MKNLPLVRQVADDPAQRQREQSVRGALRAQRKVPDNDRTAKGARIEAATHAASRVKGIESQLRRLDERKAFNDEVRAAIEMPPEPIGDLVTLSRMSTGIEWRSIEVTGTYQPDVQFVVVNRSHGGVAGDLVVTPMLLEDGRTLLVQRGFVPLGQTAAPAPAGEVEIVGRLRELAATGVDAISIGALTHSAPALDLSLLLEPL